MVTDKIISRLIESVRLATIRAKEGGLTDDEFEGIASGCLEAADSEFQSSRGLGGTARKTDVGLWKTLIGEFVKLSYHFDGYSTYRTSFLEVVSQIRFATDGRGGKIAIGEVATAIAGTDLETVKTETGFVLIDLKGFRYFSLRTGEPYLSSVEGEAGKKYVICFDDFGSMDNMIKLTSGFVVSSAKVSAKIADHETFVRSIAAMGSDLVIMVNPTIEPDGSMSWSEIDPCDRIPTVPK